MEIKPQKAFLKMILAGEKRDSEDEFKNQICKGFALDNGVAIISSLEV